MTTGSFNHDVPPNHIDSKVWSGTNGRTEIVNGFSRVKYNAYTMTREAKDQYPNNYLGVNYYASVGDVTSRYPGISNNDYIILLNKMNAKVRGHSFNAVIPVAEHRQTVRLIKNNLQTVGRALIDVKHGNFRRAMDRLGLKQRPLSPLIKSVSGRWLELQYGWLPLINDVNEAVNAFHAITKGPRRYHLKAARHRKGTCDLSLSPAFYKCPSSYEVGYSMVYDFDEPVSTERALGLQDPATVVWEIMPYSFVIDWFIPIGAYLEALEQTPLLTGRYAITQFKRLKSSAVDASVNSNPIIRARYTGCRNQFERVEMQRTVGSGQISVPLPVFKPIDQSLTGLHITNAIALILAQLNGGPTVH